MEILREKDKNTNGVIVLDLCIGKDEYEFASDIQSAMELAEYELEEITSKLNENENTLKKLTSACDKTDYILAASSGVLCGLIDIFLVGKAGESALGNVSDKWFENRTMDFARLCGWDDSSNASISSAIRYLEKKFKIPYDQTGLGDVAKLVFDLNPKNHHFKSLGHNPNLLGLFFSILDQFNNTSHFISAGELISLQEADNNFELRGENFSSKLFCGFINWLGHLVSDMTGSSASRSRGMGLPSPFWTWTNDIIAIKRKFNIATSEFDKSINEIALKIYKEGYDLRFEAASALPVFVNELLVRTMYTLRRLVGYLTATQSEDRNFELMWQACEPFSNASVKRMLTVAHGTFCLMDSADALAHGFIQGKRNFSVEDCFLRINVVGMSRFSISLYGEAIRYEKRKELKEAEIFIRQEKITIVDYVQGLKVLSEVYDDKDLLLFTEELMTSEMYTEAFEKSVRLAEKRKVPKDKILRDKADIDLYFKGGSSCESK